MTNKVTIAGVVIAIVIALAALSAALTAGTPQGFGSSVNGGNVVDYNAVNTTDAAGYYIQGTQVLSSTFATVGTFTQGGGVFATSSVGTVTYPASAFDTESLIEHTAASVVTATLPASSTLSSFIPTAGQSRTVCINAITSTVTLAGGTGTDLNSASTTKAIIAGGLGCLNFVRKTNTDIEVLLTTGI